MRIRLTNSDVLYFFIYAALGWVFEMVYCALIDGVISKRGFFFGPYCPIYGFGAIIVLKLVRPYFKSAFSLFLASMAGCTILEYLTSVTMESVFHIKLWDYSGYFLNYEGRVCLLNSFLFGVMALGVVYIMHPFISNKVQKLSEKSRTILSCTGLIIILLDLLLSSISYMHGVGNLSSSLY